MNRLRLMLVVFLSLVAASAPVSAQKSEADDQIRELRQQIEAMQAQLDSMQARLAEIQAEPAGEQDDAPVEPPDPRTGSTYLAALDEEGEAADAGDESVIDAEAVPTPAKLDQRLSRLENVSDDWIRDVRFGGAVRLNYAWRDYDEGSKDRVGDFELELFRLNADGTVGDVKLSAEWRRYNDFQAIHHAWVGYDFTDRLEMQLGINQVPFGILPFASHSFWFGGTYYLGFEDDYDTGVKFVHRPSDDWTLHYAFYKNPEYADDGRFGRYSFDLVTGGDQRNTETNQFNLRAERHLRFDALSRVDVGVSLQGGEVHNDLTGADGERYAIAAHADAYFGRWNFQLQGLQYDIDPENPPGVDDSFVQAGAFDFPFLMASDANVYSVNVARSFNASLGPITGGTCYNDFTFINPSVRNSADSIQNVTGCSLVAGGVFAYFDWITGKNMWFVGGDGIGRNATTAGKWRSRLNVNIGFYF